MEEKRIQILQQVGELFMNYGIKSVTMDDVAKALKMSKKTLYQYVEDKADLVQQVMGGYCQMEMSACDLIGQNNQENAIDEILEITKYVTAQIKHIHPSIHYDMEKYYPDAWETFQKFKQEYIYNAIASNLERGIEQGWYRQNLDIPIIARLYIYKMDMFFDPQVFPPRQYKFDHVYMEMMRYHIRGVASADGLKYLSKKSAQEKLNFD